MIVVVGIMQGRDRPMYVHTHVRLIIKETLENYFHNACYCHAPRIAYSSCQENFYHFPTFFR
jgi:hypothetical protein